MPSAESTFLRNVLHVEACVGGGAAEEGRVREAEGRGRRGKRRKGGDVEERTGRKGLLQLLGLIGIVDAEGVEVLRAADFELCAAARLLDAHCPGVLPSRRQQEVFDLPDVLRLLRSQPPAIITRSESQDPQALALLRNRSAPWRRAAGEQLSVTQRARALLFHPSASLSNQLASVTVARLVGSRSDELKHCGDCAFAASTKGLFTGTDSVRPHVSSASCSLPRR